MELVQIHLQHLSEQHRCYFLYLHGGSVLLIVPVHVDSKVVVWIREFLLGRT
jgi:hypothetical protein